MFVNMDFAKIEDRLLAGICASNAPASPWANKLWGYAAQLPKKHPFRFALLYCAGPATAERMTRAGTSQAERQVHLEAEIQCFEDQIAANDGVALCDSITDIVDE